MMRMAEVVTRSLQWTQPSALRMNYELRVGEGEEVASTLRFRSSFGSFATGESQDGCWTFKRVGFWKPRVTVRTCGSEEDIASFANQTWSGGGTLTLADGREFRVSNNFWQTKLEIQDRSEEMLIRFHNGGVIHLSAKVEVAPEGARLAELPWMLMLGWYLIVMTHRDSGAASAAAAAG